MKLKRHLMVCISDGSVEEPGVWPVVVVGAGPAGLVAAITLARYGIGTLVLNRRTDTPTHPRATVVSLRSMELFRSWGLESTMRAGGDDVEWRMLAATALSKAAEGELIEVGYPSSSESARISPTRPAAVPQDHLEAVLIKHLHGLAAACIEPGVGVEDVWTAANRIQLRLRSRASADLLVQARYVIGADGARSVVRQRLGIGMPSTDDVLRSFSAVIRAPLWEVVGPYRYGIYVTDTPAPGTFLPAGQRDRWVYAFSWDPRVENGPDLDAKKLIARIRAAAGVPDLPVRLLDQRRFTFSAAIADHFGSGDAFLIGDAAHRMTPRGGTGMNTAIADGFNLAWKMSWVLRGWAPDSLLATYKLERRPVAEHNLARSLDPMGSRRSAWGELRFDLGHRLPHVWLEAANGRISSLDLLGPGLTSLTADQRLSQYEEASASTPPIAKHHLDRHTAAALGAAKSGGLLLRPDGLIWDPPVEAA